MDNNPMQSSRAFDTALDASGKSGVFFHYAEIVCARLRARRTIAKRGRIRDRVERRAS
jgi:hypothetical protein